MSANGARNGRAVLTERQVVEILLTENPVYTHLARAYGVDDALIRRIIIGNQWRHLPRDRAWLLARLSSLSGPEGAP